MAIPETTYPDFDRSDFMATEQGIDWLEDHPYFGTVLNDFYREEDKPELLVRSGQFIAEGFSGETWKFDDAAVKITTASTGIGYWKFRNSKRDNLMGQFIFLNSLKEHLDSRDQYGVTVPEQFFALQAVAGQIKAEQFMEGWHSLGEFYTRENFSTDRIMETNRRMKARVIDAIGLTTLRLSLDISTHGKKDDAHNLLIPIEEDVPEEGEICIIDQPGTVLSKPSIVSLTTSIPKLSKIFKH